MYTGAKYSVAPPETRPWNTRRARWLPPVSPMLARVMVHVVAPTPAGALLWDRGVETLIGVVIGLAVGRLTRRTDDEQHEFRNLRHRAIDGRDPRHGAHRELLAARGQPPHQRLGHHRVADPLRGNDE